MGLRKGTSVRLTCLSITLLLFANYFSIYYSSSYNFKVHKVKAVNVFI